MAILNKRLDEGSVPAREEEVVIRKEVSIYVYAIFLGWLGNNKEVTLSSFSKEVLRENVPQITAVSILGYEGDISYQLDEEGLHLTKKNYRVVEQVTGSADVNYILIFGGMNRKQLYQNAYSELVKKADLTGSKALVNIVTEEHLGGVPPFYFTRTITVSANVVEFTD